MPDEALDAALSIGEYSSRSDAEGMKENVKAAMKVFAKME